ncbi:MAG: hypothetical protein LPK26_04715 [Bacillaceae bacterium]|nr:hypothetical protein [Bacillaceae bacterium]
MKVVNNAGKTIEVTETAFNLLYKDRGFKIYKPQTSKPSTTKKKVTRNDRTTKGE